MRKLIVFVILIGVLLMSVVDVGGQMPPPPPTLTPGPTKPAPTPVVEEDVLLFFPLVVYGEVTR